jgi:hypothetical protein
VVCPETESNQGDEKFSSKPLCQEFAMLNPKNEVDKERFEKLKDTQVERGRDEEQAIDVAASEVKEMRRREGRSKEEAE